MDLTISAVAAGHETIIIRDSRRPSVCSHQNDMSPILFGCITHFLGGYLEGIWDPSTVGLRERLDPEICEKTPYFQRIQKQGIQSLSVLEFDDQCWDAFEKIGSNTFRLWLDDWMIADRLTCSNFMSNMSRMHPPSI